MRVKRQLIGGVRDGETVEVELGVTRLSIPVEPPPRATIVSVDEPLSYTLYVDEYELDENGDFMCFKHVR